ncbi:O-antigen ligase family protein [Actinacidiphila yeochonensis]|uniref:O-antigen ligase family protein n=1 Tax=Actinacidiphila yeochonensis TaxID=89050 RepID=UPI0006905092|nr:O-antigen ligase family protein [Actinacidiphila yeochonensis]
MATVLLLALPVPPGNVSSSGKVTPADAASAVLVLACAVRLLRDRRRPLRPAAALLLGAPLVAFAASAVVTPDPGAGATGFVRYAQVFVLVPAAVVLLLRDRRDFAVLAGAVVALALVQGGVGVWQYATGGGASYQGQDVRAVGTFGPSDIMGMATVVAYGLLVAAGYALAPGRRGVRIGAGACAAVLLVPLTVSFSRGTWIATAVALGAVTVLAGRRQAVRVLGTAAACAVLLVGGAGVGSQMITERLTSITQVTDAPDPSVTDRYTLWSAAVSMWREHPVLGVGLKRFPAERDSHASLALDSGSDTDGAGQGFTREPLLSPHNMYLLALSEQGLTGCLLLGGSWAALLAAGTARLLRTRRTAAGTARLLRTRRTAAADRSRPTAPLPGTGTGGGTAASSGSTAPRPGGTAVPLPAGSVGPGLAAVGLLLWTCVDFLYADIGGPVTPLTAVVLGLAAWWALEPSDGRRS